MVGLSSALGGGVTGPEEGRGVSRRRAVVEMVRVARERRLGRIRGSILKVLAAERERRRVAD